MNTVQVTIKATEQQQELLISQLEDLNATGFEQTDDHLIAYFPELHFNSYEISRLLAGREFHTTFLAEQNWNQVWESNFQEVVVGTFCGIRADFHPPIDGVAYEILITPKMSFGTGHHATTYMMIDQMQHLECKGRAVLDFGTGTGILAILAKKMGAATVVAIDVDEWSIKNALENSRQNNCPDISFHLTSDIPLGKFDILLANINRNVILEYLHDLTHAVVPSGSLLFSGLLQVDQADIMAACNREGLELVKQIEKNNWISLLFLNRK
jgi:ribosomal protein L11 methyltransferase